MLLEDFNTCVETLQKIRERTRLTMQDPKVMSCKNNLYIDWLHHGLTLMNAYEKYENLESGYFFYTFVFLFYYLLINLFSI